MREPMAVLSEELRDQIRALFPDYPNKRAVVLPALHLVQDAQRHVAIEAVREIAELLELHPSEVHDTMSFYQFFKDEKHKLGKHRVWVCRSISCMLRGGEELLQHMCERLQVHPGQTSEFAECIGACDGAPCILVDDEAHMNITPEKADELLKSL
jgi:NADH-quinone oxidoreductase subunit E